MFGSEATIPVEIGVTTQQTLNIDLKANQAETMLNLELLEKARDQVAIRETKYKQRMEAYYHTWVKHERFKPRDLVLRNNKKKSRHTRSQMGKTIHSWRNTQMRIIQASRCRRQNASSSLERQKP